MSATSSERPPLIAHVIVNLDVGGLENGLVNLVNRIPAARYRQAIVCLKEQSSFRRRIERGDVDVVALHKRDGKDFANYAKLYRLFRAWRPAIVHTRNLGTIDAVFPAKLAGVPALVHGEHGWDVHDAAGTNRKYRFLRRVCARLIDRQIAVSEHIAAWLRDTVQLDPARVRQIYNGVDTTKFRPDPAGRAALPPAGFAQPDSFVVGTVGRMATIKDPLTLAQAFERLHAGSPQRPRLRLVMVGDGPLYEDVKRALVGSAACDVTWLPGRRDDVAELMRGLDLFVLPSRNEGISNTILEAMATGLPVVATAVGGNPELVVAGRTGALVPPADPEAMAAAIGAYVAAPELARAHGAEGRRRVLERFSIDGMVSKYMDCYDAVFREKHAKAGA
jgi:sugar transferase (PEP-CTERM/EpsH1 system associated)